MADALSALALAAAFASGAVLGSLILFRVRLPMMMGARRALAAFFEDPLHDFEAGIFREELGRLSDEQRQSISAAFDRQGLIPPEIAIAQVRAAWVSSEDPGRALTPAVQRITAAAAIAPGWTVADIGAGAGFFSFLWSPLVGDAGRIFAIEANPAMVAMLSSEVARRGVRNVVPLYVRPGHLGLPPGVDLALLVNTHLFQRGDHAHHQAYVDQLADALVPGGRVLIYNDFLHRRCVGTDRCGRVYREDLDADAVAALASRRLRVVRSEPALPVPAGEPAAAEVQEGRPGYLLVLERC